MSEWKPDLCIYHGNCDDGFGAAWAVWKRWGNEVAYVPGFYGKPLPDAAGRHVLFVDFSAKRAEIDAMAQTAKSIVIIDHHKTAQADLEPFMCSGVNGGPPDLNDMPERIPAMLRDLFIMDRPPIIAFFDMQSSGARLAWEFAIGIEHNEPPPTIISFIEDRDLWRFAYGDRTKQFSAALRTYPMDFAVWDNLAGRADDLVREGEVILRAHQANIGKILQEVYISNVGGHEVPTVNAPYHYASDAAHEMLAKYPDAPFAACWFRRADGKIQYSLRSEDSRLDVSEVAKANGGGGHRNAAGFEEAV